MKDSEFIELLNLYLDHEITPADAARLEAEVLGNPARREIYREYCRIQKGCKLLAQEFVGESPAPAIEDGKIAAFEGAQHAKRRTGMYVAGGFAAAAACVALVFVSVGRGPNAGELDAGATFAQADVPANGAALAAAPTPVTTERTIGQTVTVPEMDYAQPTLVSALTLTGSGRQANGPSSLLANTDQNGAQFEWMRTMQIAPLQRVSIEELRVPAPREIQRVRPANQTQEPMEWVAIRYQK